MKKLCLGCGIELQNKFKDCDGFVESLDYDICERCFKLKNYGQYRISTKTNIDFLDIINNIPNDSLVVYVSSLLTLNLDYLTKFKRVILVLTKRDILPKSVNDNKIISYIKKRNTFLDIEVISSFKNYNIDSLFNKINKYKSNKEVYIIGNTNSGKSTLINSLIKNYSNKENNITTSMYPSTTLSSIEININDNLMIIDTPGIINEGSIINYIDAKTIKKITPKKEIKPITFQLHGKGTLLIEDLVRIEYDTDSSATFYLANGIKIKKINALRGDLATGYKKEFNVNNNKDIVIEDLGFIKFTKGANIVITTENKLNIYERDNLI